MRKFEPLSVAAIAELWRKQYYDGSRWGSLAFGDSREIYEAIKKAESLEAIEKIIGCQSWTQLFCGECKEYSREGVTLDNFGEETEICKTCLHKALRLVCAK